MNELKNVSKTLLDQLYNKEGRHDKEQFLIECLEDDLTRESYTVFLVQVAYWERLINKDLYEFGINDIQDFFANNFSSSHTALRTLFSICKQYGNWAVKKGLNVTGTNPFNSLSFKKDILLLLNKNALDKEIITKEQLWMIIDNLKEEKNAQDLVCLMSPFYAIKGDKNLELRFLKRQDIDEKTNIVTIKKLIENIEINKETDKKVFVYTETEEIDRRIELPKEVIKLLIEAADEKNYNKLGNNSNISYPLVNSKYVIRPLSNKNAIGDGRVAAQTIASRCKKVIMTFKEKLEKEEDKEKNKFLREKFKNVNLGNLSVANIWNSGKIHALKQIELENGKVENDDLKKVNFMFTGSELNYENTKTLYQVYTKAE